MSDRPLTPPERALLDALRGLRFGSVEAIVHDGRVLRIERKEKLRFELDPTSEEPGAKADDNQRRRPDLRSSRVSVRRGNP